MEAYTKSRRNSFLSSWIWYGWTKNSLDGVNEKRFTRTFKCVSWKAKKSRWIRITEARVAPSPSFTVTKFQTSYIYLCRALFLRWKIEKNSYFQDTIFITSLLNFDVNRVAWSQRERLAPRIIRNCYCLEIVTPNLPTDRPLQIASWHAENQISRLLDFHRRRYDIGILPCRARK